MCSLLTCTLLVILILIIVLSTRTNDEDSSGNISRLRPSNVDDYKDDPTINDLSITPSPTTSSPTTPIPSGSPTTPMPSFSPTTSSMPSGSPTRVQDRQLNCIQTVTDQDELVIEHSVSYYRGDAHCLKLQDGQEAYFGFTWLGQFGLFVNGESLWMISGTIMDTADRWTFQKDGNLVLDDIDSNPVWTSGTFGNFDSQLKLSLERVWIETAMNYSPWSAPTRPPLENDYPDPNGALQYFAYYYPWYHRDDWTRHEYQDEPLLGKYGTDEIAVAEQHIEWALQTGISSWVVSWWGNDHLAMKHFQAGMMQAPSLDKIKFCILYETTILDERGSWYNGTMEEALYDDLKIIVDEFFDHPSYLKINGRPVLIFYITRSRMSFQEGFDGPSVLANMRERLGSDIYFIADEPFFNTYWESPDENGNAFSEDGTQVFDAYTTYNMFRNSVVQEGETATDYQLREGMPIWQSWAEQLPFFPNVMPQYYDFRGHQPLLGNSKDFMRQLREVACLPKTNFDGAPHIMFITSFNEWWEGTQIEPEDGSPENWNNYGFQFMETLAEFKRGVDSLGTPWCGEDNSVEIEGANGKDDKKNNGKDDKKNNN